MSLLSRSLLSAYGLVWKAARPVLARHHRLAEGFQDRLVPETWPFDDAQPPTLRLWIQAASGGEAWLTLALAEALAALAPPKSSLTLLLTTCTRQGLDVLEGGLSRQAKTWADAGFTLVPRYFPLDEPGLMRRAVRQVAPTAVILLETELWPGLLDAAHEEKIPVLALNARMSAKSLSGYKWLLPFWKNHAPQRIMAISDEDGRRFAALFGRDRVAVMPNIKFDRTASALPPALNEPDARDLAVKRQQAGLAPDLPLIAFSSVRQEEEPLLLPVLTALFRREFAGKPVGLALAPRHMHRVAQWETLLAGAGIPFARRSGEASAANQDRPPLLLWDTFGELQTLYSLADAVFVGGSLAPLGGQNFLEPLAEGLTPCMGPHWNNFYWVGEDIFTTGLARRVEDAASLDPALTACLDAIAEQGGIPGTPSWGAAGESARKDVRTRFRTWLTPRTGGAAAAAKEIARFLGW